MICYELFYAWACESRIVVIALYDPKAMEHVENLPLPPFGRGKKTMGKNNSPKGALSMAIYFSGDSWNVVVAKHTEGKVPTYMCMEGALESALNDYVLSWLLRDAKFGAMDKANRTK
jgi:hypothetical protein